MQHSMQPDQQALTPGSHGPTTVTEGRPVHCQERSNLVAQTQSPATVQGGGFLQQSCQERSNLVAQTHSPATVQGGGFPQQLIPDSHVYPNRVYRPVRQNGTHFQPHFSNYAPSQPVLNGHNGHNSVSTLFQPPNPHVQYGVDPAHSMTVNQQPNLECMGCQYPESQDAYPINAPVVIPSAEFDAWTSSQNCSCGPTCNCVYCTAHPFNAATQARIQDLSQVLANDNYWNVCAQTEDESAMDLEEDENPLGWVNMPREGPGRQPTFEQGGSINNGHSSNDFSSLQMQNPGYFTVAYPVNGDCTNATGTCLCGNDCACYGCLTHQGHELST